MIEDRETLHRLLDEAQVGFLAMSRDGEPYVVPVSFVRSGETIFVHAARAGKKSEFLRANPRASFCAVPRFAYLPGRSNFSYESVIAYGEVEFVEDPDRKRKALAVLAEKYEPGKSDAPGDACLARTAVLALRIRKLTGKRGA